MLSYRLNILHSLNLNALYYINTKIYNDCEDMSRDQESKRQSRTLSL